jgi:hypothetical protein
VLDLDLGEAPDLPPVAAIAARRAGAGRPARTLQPLDFDFGSVSLDLDSAPAADPEPARAAPAGVPPPSTGSALRLGRRRAGARIRSALARRAISSFPTRPRASRRPRRWSARSSWPRSSSRSATARVRASCSLEVVAQADGPLKARAQALLDTLG